MPPTSKGQALRKQIREQWLAVYDSLDAAQQGQLRSFLRERLQQAGQGHRRTETPLPSQP
jgi:hypothetical protein